MRQSEIDTYNTQLAQRVEAGAKIDKYDLMAFCERHNLALAAQLTAPGALFYDVYRFYGKRAFAAEFRMRRFLVWSDQMQAHVKRYPEYINGMARNNDTLFIRGGVKCVREMKASRFLWDADIIPFAPASARAT